MECGARGSSMTRGARAVFSHRQARPPRGHLARISMHEERNLPHRLTWQLGGLLRRTDCRTRDLFHRLVDTDDADRLGNSHGLPSPYAHPAEQHPKPKKVGHF